MGALVQAAPEAVKFDTSVRSAAALFPEFRAWHALLLELFEVESPEWKEPQVERGLFSQRLDGMIEEITEQEDEPLDEQDASEADG